MFSTVTLCNGLAYRLTVHLGFALFTMVHTLHPQGMEKTLICHFHEIIIIICGQTGAQIEKLCTLGPTATPLQNTHQPKIVDPKILFTSPLVYSNAYIQQCGYEF